MELPDVIGFSYDEAISEITDKGFLVDELIVTRPLRATEPLGKARVLRLSPVGEAKLQVVVAYQIS